MYSAADREQNSEQRVSISTQEKKVSQDSTSSDQSGGSGFSNGESPTKMTTMPESSFASVSITASTSKFLEPSPALPLANPRKQKSTGMLSLRRSPSGARQRSGSLSGNVVKADLVPPLPLRREPEQPPKSILTPSSSSSSLSRSTLISPSLSRSPSIQFAPLPKLAPRKRKSSVPLGIAARSAMMQRRRQVMIGTSATAPYQDTKDTIDSTPAVEGSGIWTPAEAEAHMTRQLRSREKERERMLKKQEKELEKDAAKSALRDHGYDDEVENDDPLVVFGRLMKDAWRKMGRKDVKPKGIAKVDPQIRTQTKAEVDLAPSTNQSQLPNSSIPNGSLKLGIEMDQITLKESKLRVDDGLVDHGSDTPTEEDDHNDDDTDLDTDIDPNEVDVSKIIPLRAGSPPPLHNQSASQSQSETSSTAGSDDTAGPDLSMIPPSATDPPSPTANTHTHTFKEPLTLEETPSKKVKDHSVTMIRSERSTHDLSSLELTPLSPFLVT